MACAICETRRPRRFCPGVQGDICPICCGTGREETVGCPLECEFLQDARRHERLAPLDPSTLPNQDIRVSDRFLRDRQELLAALSAALAAAALRIPGVVDSDVREALSALIRTYRTLDSGVLYESRPANPLAGGLCGLMQQAAAEFRQAETRQLGMARTRDADVLGVLAVLERLGIENDNGRRRGRAFVDALRRFYPPQAEAPPPAASPLILP